MAQFEITWEAPEFEYHEKDISWYWMTVIIAALIIAFSVWEKNFLFGFFIVIAEILVIAWGNHRPQMIAFHMDEHDISIGNRRSYSLKEFESWSADSDEAWADLMFNFRAKIKPPLKILVPAATLEEIRKNLKTTLREVEHQITFLDAVEKLLRF